MPDSLLFDGTDDRREFNGGSMAGTGAMSVAMIVKPTSDSVWRNLGGWNSVDAHLLISDGNQLWAGDGVTFSNSTFTVTVAEGWVLLATSRPSGSGLARFHKYVYGTSTWTHQAGSGDAITNLATLTTLSIGSNKFGGTPSQFFAGNILIDGMWDSNLSDGTIETLELDMASWVTAAPDEARRYDTAGTITPFVGTSTQTASTGGTLDTGDAPAGWSDEEPPVMEPALISQTVGGRW